ncbi:transmembrane 220 family protein [Maribacter sp. MMG018]|uniref:transmembrane 220 family protein n=1 Tax=Maribacter sp. MMG018 TaxID=2822688 RepID=UPI001B363B88|nr:transmembrane 220 family protein [Maribacter sp. MMG018]MBQ4914538.1 transmembrane 220 family protein [Maribacter sp. MMG018]
MRLLYKIIGFLFTLFFAWGAIVQYNDPDAFIWIAVYVFAAIISLLFALDRVKYIIPLILGVVCFIGFVYLYPSDFQGFDLDDGDIKTVELGREAFGLLIIAIVMFFYSFRLGKKLKV